MPFKLRKATSLAVAPTVSVVVLEDKDLGNSTLPSEATAPTLAKSKERIQRLTSGVLDPAMEGSRCGSADMNPEPVMKTTKATIATLPVSPTPTVELATPKLGMAEMRRPPSRLCAQSLKTRTLGTTPAPKSWRVLPSFVTDCSARGCPYGRLPGHLRSSRLCSDALRSSRLSSTSG
jgi:hypothetical protein